MNIQIPGYKTLDLSFLVLDYNGTIAVDGQIPPEVREALVRLSKDLQIHVLTADTHGTARAMCPGTSSDHPDPFQPALPWIPSWPSSAPWGRSAAFPSAMAATTALCAKKAPFPSPSSEQKALIQSS